MKYSNEDYLDTDFYPGGEGESNYSRKLVITRKVHKCVNCCGEVAKGLTVLLETCVLEDEGRVSARTCLPCLDKWIDHIKGLYNGN